MEKSYLLSFDISTTCVGLSLFDYNTEKVLEIKQIEPKIKKPNPDSVLYEKANLVREVIESYKALPIKHIWIEEPLLNSNNIWTVATLIKFNGIISMMCYDILGIAPKYISSYDARAKAFPQLMQPGSVKNKNVLFGAYKKKSDNIDDIQDDHKKYYKADKTGVVTLDKKKVVFDEVCKVYPNLPWIKDKKGGFKQSNYDMSDSITIALAVFNQKVK
jgi:hypothetical protein